VREHVIAGLKAKDPRTWFVAVHNATLHVCEDDPGNVPVEQDAITFSPEIRFFRADRCLPISEYRSLSYLPTLSVVGYFESVPAEILQNLSV
jgi:hypothetical protein